MFTSRLKLQKTFFTADSLTEQEKLRCKKIMAILHFSEQAPGFGFLCADSPDRLSGTLDRAAL